MDPECLIPYVEIDSELPPELLNKDTISSFEILKPFGTDNPNPIFSVSGAKLTHKRLMSEGKHAAFRLDKQGRVFETVIFGGGELYDSFCEGDTVDTAGIIQINSWNNTDKIQIVAREMRLSETKEEMPECISRNDLAAAYRFLRKHSHAGVLKGSPDVLARQTGYEYGVSLSGAKFRNMLRVFAELKLLTYIENDNSADIYLLESSGKVNLGDSKVLAELNKKGEVR